MSDTPESPRTQESVSTAYHGGPLARPDLSAVGHARRCIYIKRCRCGEDGTCACGKHGKQCRKFAMEGTTVCGKHGGTAPQIRAAVQQRMMANLMPAVGAVVDVIKRKGRCGRCGEPCGHGSAEDKDRIKAAEFLSNRCGLGPESKVTMDVQDNAWLQKLTDDELDTVIQIMERAKGRMDAPEPVIN